MIKRIRFIRQTIIVAFGGLMLLGFTLAHAVITGDDQAEYQVFLSTRISLADASTAAEAHTGARAISADFEQEDNAFIFEVELISADGTELTANVDATTGTVLQVETETQETDDQ